MSTPSRAIRLFAMLVFCYVAVATAVEAARQPPPRPAGADRGWTIEDLGSNGDGTLTFAYGINNRGEIAGYSYNTPADPNQGTTYHGFVWDRGEMRDAGTPSGDGPGLYSILSAINDQGMAVGSHQGQVYTYRNGKWNLLGRGVPGDAVAINKAGAVAGYFFSEPDQRYHGYLFQGGHLLDLGSFGGHTFVGGLNDRGAVVGQSRDANNIGRAYLYERGRMVGLGSPGHDWSMALDINNQGVIVGSASNGEEEVAVIWERGRMRQLFPGDERTRANAINNRGDVIGSVGSNGGAFLYKDGTVTRLDQLPEVLAAGWTYLFPEDINDRGWIAGWGLKDGNPAAFHGFVLKPR